MNRKLVKRGALIAGIALAAPVLSGTSANLPQEHKAGPVNPGFKADGETV